MAVARSWAWCRSTCSGRFPQPSPGRCSTLGKSHRGARSNQRAGCVGEPLYQDVVTAFAEAIADNRRIDLPRIVGGRYGLASKEFTPAMVKAVFDNLAASSPKNHFTIGINDDVSKTSLEYDPGFVTEAPDGVGCVFYGLGADGTVGANKNSIKIIGEQTSGYAQGFFVYDSKKSGSRTISHLRFGPQPIRSTYLVQRAQFVACHQFSFLERVNMLDQATDGAVFLLNCPVRSRERVGPPAARGAGGARRQTHPASTSSMPTASRSRRAWPVASTRSCRPVSSRSPACCRATKRSRGSRMPSSQPTRARGRNWSTQISRPSIAPSRISTRSACRCGHQHTRVFTAGPGACAGRSSSRSRP